MPLYRCLFAYETQQSAWGASVLRQERILPIEVAYEFEAPDLGTLQSWLEERQTSPLSIKEVEADSMTA